MLNRNNLHQLALLRSKEAEILLRNNCFSGAYYLCGYSVECAVKACIAKQTKRYDFPSKDLTLKSYTHNITELLKAASLWSQFQVDLQASNVFSINWSVVKDWTEQSRYDKHTEKQATDLFNAVNDRQEGILQWIIRHW